MFERKMGNIQFGQDMEDWPCNMCVEPNKMDIIYLYLTFSFWFFFFLVRCVGSNHQKFEKETLSSILKKKSHEVW